MNSFRIRKGEKNRRDGFSLVETTFSIGVFSFGFLALAPLLAVGLKTSGTARQDRTGAQIAQTLVEEAKQGTLTPGTAGFDFEGNSCATAQAAYLAQTTTLALAAPLSRLTIRVTPQGAPIRARTYAVVFQAP